MLRKIHGRLCGEYRPWWQEPDAAGEYHSPERDAGDDSIDSDAYAAGRQTYLAKTKRTPPSPLPVSENNPPD